MRSGRRGLRAGSAHCRPRRGAAITAPSPFSQSPQSGQVSRGFKVECKVGQQGTSPEPRPGSRFRRLLRKGQLDVGVILRHSAWLRPGRAVAGCDN